MEKKNPGGLRATFCFAASITANGVVENVDQKFFAVKLPALCQWKAKNDSNISSSSDGSINLKIQLKMKVQKLQVKGFCAWKGRKIGTQ